MHRPASRTVTASPASLVASLLVLATTIQPAAAAQNPPPDCGAPGAIRFRHGASAGTEAGTILRTQYACYTLSARAGQRLVATVSSLEDNVTISVWHPGFRLRMQPDGPDIQGPTLPGAADQDDATSLSLRLPDTGTYLILLGLTRGGGGTFRLSVAVH